MVLLLHENFLNQSLSQGTGTDRDGVKRGCEIIYCRENCFPGGFRGRAANVFLCVKHTVLASFCSRFSALYKKQIVSLVSFLIDFSLHYKWSLAPVQEIGNSSKTDSLITASDEIISVWYFQYRFILLFWLLEARENPFIPEDHWAELWFQNSSERLFLCFVLNLLVGIAKNLALAR